MRRLRGACSGNIAILGSIDYIIGGNSIVSVVKPSKAKGSAFLGYLGLLRRPAKKRVCVGKRGVLSPGYGIPGMQRGVNVIFRGFGLFSRLSVVKGLAVNPVGLLNEAGRRTRTRNCRLLGVINLTRGTSTVPSRLDNNRGRHITVTHALTVGPRVVLFSRPASTLSPAVISRILSMVHALTGAKVAVLVIARRVGFTHSISGHVFFVSGKCV